MSSNVDYAQPNVPSKYVCHNCGATNCKLWREFQTFDDQPKLLCATCAAKDQNRSIDGIDDKGAHKDREGRRTDSIGNYSPAVPIEGKFQDAYWGYTSVPEVGVAWWKSLPTFAASSASNKNILDPSIRKLYEQVPEVQLYYIINTQGGSIFWINHDLADGRIPETDRAHEALRDLQLKVDYAVDQTKRFGVTQPRDDNGHATPEYQSWFRWWDTYTRQMPGIDQDRMFEIFDRIGDVIDGKKPGSVEQLTEQLKQYRPQGEWKQTEAK